VSALGKNAWPPVAGGYFFALDPIAHVRLKAALILIE